MYLTGTKTSGGIVEKQSNIIKKINIRSSFREGPERILKILDNTVIIAFLILYGAEWWMASLMKTCPIKEGGFVSVAAVIPCICRYRLTGDWPGHIACRTDGPWYHCFLLCMDTSF